MKQYGDWLGTSARMMRTLGRGAAAKTTDELIELRGFHDGIARAAERVVAPVVGVEHDDVERFGGVQPAAEPVNQEQQCHEGEREEGERFHG